MITGIVLSLKIGTFKLELNNDLLAEWLIILYKFIVTTLCLYSCVVTTCIMLI